MIEKKLIELAKDNFVSANGEIYPDTRISDLDYTDQEAFGFIGDVELAFGVKLSDDDVEAILNVPLSVTASMIEARCHE